MATNLTNMGITFNPVYTLRQQFGADALLRGGLLDLKSAAEVKANRQFNDISDLGNFLTKTTRHQQIQASEWQDLTYNGRRLTWNTLYLPLRVDKEWEITQAAVNDPMSAISKLLAGRVRETIYRTVLAAAAGSVLTGSPQTTGTSVSATADGVITIDGTAGWTRALFQQIIEDLFAQKYQLADIEKAYAFISPSMNTAYLNIESVINRLYSSFNKNAVLTQKILDTINVEVVAGSSADVSWTAPDSEILPTSGTTTTIRSGVLLMPDAMAAVVEDMQLWVNDNPTTNGGYVDNRIMVAEFRLGAMRKLGQRVMLLNETMPA